jgi:hypothetical protein
MTDTNLLVDSCFIAGTAVITSEGVKNIENITSDDLVLTHTGLFKPVTFYMKREYTGDLIMIKPHSTGLPIICTPEHPIYAREYKTVATNRKGIYKNSIIAELPEFVKARDLNKKSFFVGMKIETKIEYPVFQMEKYINQNVANEIYFKRLNDPDFYWMMGYYVGDGWIGTENNGPRIMFAIADKDNEYIVEKLQKVLDIKVVKANKKIPEACKTYRVYHKETATILSDFGKYAFGKKIPDWLLKAPCNLIQSFIDGWLAADGCYDEKLHRCRLITVSRDLAINLQRLYAKLGIIVSISLSKRTGKTSVINGIECKLRDVYEICYYDKIKMRHTFSYVEDGYVWYSIAKIEPINKAQIKFVQPIETKIKNTLSDHKIQYEISYTLEKSYTANGIAVHNCSNF